MFCELFIFQVGLGRPALKMSLALVQGYSSEEEEAARNDSDDESDENEKRNEYPEQKPSMPLQSTKGSLLPSAFDAFSEVTGPPEFLNNSASEPIPTRPSEKRNSFGGWQAAKDPRIKKEPRAGVVLEAKAQLVGIHERVRSDVVGTRARGPATAMAPPKNVPSPTLDNVRKTPGAAMPPPEDAAKLLRMCLQCGVPKTYSNAREGLVCPVCGDRPPGNPNHENEKKKGSTIKDKEKSKRLKGQSSHASWKSETEMQLRQQFD